MAKLVLDTNTLFITPFYHFNTIEKDPDDNKFVDCAIAADAEYVVTNDTHFRVLETIEWPKVAIITIKEFEKKL